MTEGEPNRPLHHFVVPLPREWEAKVAPLHGGWKIKNTPEVETTGVKKER